MRISLYI